MAEVMILLQRATIIITDVIGLILIDLEAV